jgi:putative peptidoglycan lipid II flippase
MRALGVSAALLALISALGQAFVVVREVYVAAQEGTSAQLDALLIALVAPTVAVSLLSSSTQAAMVPALIDMLARGGRTAASRLAGVILTAIIAGGVVAATIIVLFADVAIAVSGPGLDGPQRREAAGFLPIVVPLIFLAPAASLLAAVCQVHGMFRPIALSWIAGPVASLMATVILWDSLGLTALAIGISADAAATFIVLVLWLIRVRLLPLPGSGIQRADVTRFVRHAAPLAAGSSVLQLNLITDRAVASLLANGAVSALRFGDRIVRAPISVLTPAWSTVIYPAIARRVQDDDDAIGKAATEALRFVLSTFLPLVFATAALAPLVVAFAYQRGAFTETATTATAGVVAALAPLILLWLVHPIVAGAHNARRRGGLLGRVAVLNAVFNLALNLLFGALFGVAGVALSTSLTGWILTLVLVWRLRVLEPGFDLGAVRSVSARAIGASALASVPLAWVCWIARPSLEPIGQFGLLAALTIVGGAGYLALARFVGLREPLIVSVALADILRTRLRRLRLPGR